MYLYIMVVFVVLYVDLKMHYYDFSNNGTMSKIRIALMSMQNYNLKCFLLKFFSFDSGMKCDQELCL